jgi:hypothetical protein
MNLSPFQVELEKKELFLSYPHFFLQAKIWQEIITKEGS